MTGTEELLKNFKERILPNGAVSAKFLKLLSTEDMLDELLREGSSELDTEEVQRLLNRVFRLIAVGIEAECQVTDHLAQFIFDQVQGKKYDEKEALLCLAFWKFMRTRPTNMAHLLEELA